MSDGSLNGWTAGDFPMGRSLTFRDSNATVSDGVDGLATGTVNGPTITDDDGQIIFVPVFTERDHGREATTVYVAIANVVG